MFYRDSQFGRLGDAWVACIYNTLLLNNLYVCICVHPWFFNTKKRDAGVYSPASLSLKSYLTFRCD